MASTANNISMFIEKWKEILLFNIQNSYNIYINLVHDILFDKNIFSILTLSKSLLAVLMIKSIWVPGITRPPIFIKSENDD